MSRKQTTEQLQARLDKTIASMDKLHADFAKGCSLVRKGQLGLELIRRKMVINVKLQALIQEKIIMSDTGCAITIIDDA